MTTLGTLDVEGERWARKMLPVFARIMREDAERGGTVSDAPRNPCCGVSHMSFDRPPWCRPRKDAA